ncbi:hypothetical protein BT93_G1384 [Corymbia citriodora subsp. variegata]|nr:hypothetical protein BT93_G1384 [Corymbia citriodora subsp. variegata]
MWPLWNSSYFLLESLLKFSPTGRELPKRANTVGHMLYSDCSFVGGHCNLLNETWWHPFSLSFAINKSIFLRLEFVFFGKW